jgi:serine/threonine protein kinase
LYSLGCTLYELSTGHPPFAKYVGIYEKLKAHAEVSPPAIAQFRGDMPDLLSGIIARLLAKRPEERFSDAASLISALDAAAPQRTTPDCALASESVRIQLPAKRGWFWPAVAGGAILGGIAATVGYLGWRGRSDWRPVDAASNTGSPPEITSRTMSEFSHLTLYLAPNGESGPIQTLSLEPPTPRVSAILGPEALFKLDGELHNAANWYLVWVDPGGGIQVESQSSEPTPKFQYPPKDEFQGVNSNDPIGCHFLVIVTTVTPASDYTKRRAVELSKRAITPLVSILTEDYPPVFMTAGTFPHLGESVPAGFSIAGVVILRTQRQ